MPRDTSRDPRLLVADIALRRLSRLLPLRHGIQPRLSKPETTALLKRMESNLMACRFMYLEPEQLATEATLLELAASARTLRESVDDALTKRDFNPTTRADLVWCFQIFEGLPERLRRQGTSLAAGVDLVTVRVKHVSRRDKLWITRVDAGGRELTVVTNMSGIDAGRVLAAACLPPVELAGTTSEAMFLGQEPRSEAPGTLLDDSVVDAREAASILHEELGR